MSHWTGNVSAGLPRKASSQKSTNRRNQRYMAAILSAIYMGVGQLYNGQWAKGIIFILYHTFIALTSIPVLVKNLRGLITLGDTPMKDNSLFLLVYGIVSVLLLMVVIGIYVLNIRDAYKNGQLRDKGQKPAGFIRSVRNLFDTGYPYLILSPGLIALTAITFLPLVFSILIGFTNYDLYHSPPGNLMDWVGLKNFHQVLTEGSWARTFRNVLGWTVLWTVLSTVTSFGLGTLVAILLNNSRIRFKKVIRTVLIIPWAIPGFTSILVWRGLLNTNFGAINQLLAYLGIPAIPWFENVFWARTALVLVNLWLGFPYNMILVTGILQSIPGDLYEAARVDGATGWQKFRQITLPLLLFSMAPLLIMQFAYNFNNFNIIYLLNDGGPAIFGQQGAGGTDILISWVFKLTFNLLKFNYASAISLIIFLIIAGLSVYNFRRTKSFQEEKMLQ